MSIGLRGESETQSSSWQTSIVAPQHDALVEARFVQVQAASWRPPRRRRWLLVAPIKVRLDESWRRDEMGSVVSEASEVNAQKDEVELHSDAMEWTRYRRRGWRLDGSPSSSWREDGGAECEHQAGQGGERELREVRERCGRTDGGAAHRMC